MCTGLGPQRNLTFEGTRRGQMRVELNVGFRAQGFLKEASDNTLFAKLAMYTAAGGSCMPRLEPSIEGQVVGDIASWDQATFEFLNSR